MIQNSNGGGKMNNFRLISIKNNSQTEKNKIRLSSDIASEVGLREGEPVTLKIGLLTLQLQVKMHKNREVKNNIDLNPSTIKRLHLKTDRKLGINIDNNTISLGPVVGIMVELSPEISKPFGGQTFFIKQLLDSGRKIGEICFAFDPYSINWDKKIVYGYTYNGSKWIRGVYLIPEIIYPREKGYNSKKVRIRQRLKSLGVKFLNPILVGKWQTHKMLMQNESLTPYIPETKLIKNFSQVDHMIARYKALYLKPINGSQGKNIIKLVKTKKNSAYHYKYQLNNQIHQGIAHDIQGLRVALRKVMGNRSYIMQKQINLIRARGSLMDVRIIVQKDHTGTWDVTGMAFRVGRTGNITSNISAGGTAKNVKTMLLQQFKDAERVQKIIKEIEQLALEAAKTMEKTVGLCGEMGIDIGVDKNGKVWFIEANLRPARRVFLLMGDKAARLKSVTKPMLYCRYLAGFY